MEERNDIVIYKSEDGLVKMEAMVDPVNETIWANQKAIAALFDCTKQNVKIFASGELERSTVVKEILTTAQSAATCQGCLPPQVGGCSAAGGTAKRRRWAKIFPPATVYALGD